MLQYLIILLDDTSTSYCHYDNNRTKKRLISLDDLRAGILFAMKQNLVIQFVYPSFELPKAYREVIESIDHVKIMPADAQDVATADVVVFNSCTELTDEKTVALSGKIFILRMHGRDAARHIPTFAFHGRLNIVLTDVETFTEADFDAYRDWLALCGAQVAELYRTGKTPKINILTDRITLDKMNNCNAGCENITLAPNGKFYVCPAFYLEDENDSIGSPKTGLDIRNPQLYRLSYAPICRACDAYQCKRCVWLNRKTTGEVNTPSHEQCVAVHLERNAARNLCNDLKEAGFFPDRDIPSIDYSDPFEIVKR